MQNTSKTAAVILAGGTSSRMGTDKNKLLLPLQNRPVLAHVIEAAAGSQARPIILVLGHQATDVRNHIQPYLDLDRQQLTIVENPDYRQGMSTSMKAGLNALLSHGYKQDLEAAIFLLGDQPLIHSALIDQLLTLREQTGKRIALPLFQGQRGNPVVFSLDLSNELMEISGDEGGRSVLKRHQNEIATLEVDSLALNFDVDTWEAYQTVLATWEQQKQDAQER